MTDFQKALMKHFPYVMILLVAVYATGLTPRFFGEQGYYFSNFMLIYGLPAVIAITAFVYATRNGFKWYFFPIGPVIFTSSIFVFYGGDVGFFLNALVYLVFSLVFTMTGSAIYRKKEYIRSDPNLIKEKKKK